MLLSVLEEGVIVGFVCIVKILVIVLLIELLEVIKVWCMDYYCYMVSGLCLVIVVVEDIDGVEVIGVYWGEINILIYKGFGLSGVLINGVMCDFGDFLEGFFVIVGLIGLSYGFVYVKEIVILVMIFGFMINDGDFVYVDCYGVFVVLLQYLDYLVVGIYKFLDIEWIILDVVQSVDFDFEKFEVVWVVFEQVRIQFKKLFNL